MATPGFGLVDGLRGEEIDQAGAAKAVGFAVQEDIHDPVLSTSGLILSWVANRPKPERGDGGVCLAVNTSLAIASAVTGVRRMPLR